MGLEVGQPTSGLGRRPLRFSNDGPRGRCNPRGTIAASRCNQPGGERDTALTWNGDADSLLRTKPFGAEQADAVVLRFEGLVTRSLALIELQETGDQAAQASATTRAGLRGKLRGESLRHLVEIGKAAATDKLKLPGGSINEARFRALAHTILAEAKSNEALFLRHGMWAGAIAELTARLEEYDRASADGHAGRAAHTGARAELKVLGVTLIAMVKQLEGMMLIRFRQDPNLKGAWASARNVAWPAPAVGESGVSGGGKAAA